MILIGEDCLDSDSNRTWRQLPQGINANSFAIGDGDTMAIVSISSFGKSAPAENSATLSPQSPDG